MIAANKSERLASWIARLYDYGWAAPANIDVSIALSRVEPPLMLKEMPQNLTDEHIRRALFELGIVMKLTSAQKTQSDILERLALLRLDEMYEIHEEIHDRFIKRVSSITNTMLALLIPIYIWQMLMIDEIASHIAAQTILGSRGKYSSYKNYMNNKMQFQLWFIQRFGDYLAYAFSTGTPASEPRTINRAASYGGTGRAAFYQTLEKHLKDILTDGTEGYIVQYVAKDDPRTCQPCHDAQGYYLPTHGPYPGEVCLGQAFCRCTRVIIYDPYTYRIIVEEQKKKLS